MPKGIEIYPLRYAIHPLIYAISPLILCSQPPLGMHTYRSRSSARSSSTWNGTSTGLAASLVPSASEEGGELANRSGWLLPGGEPERVACLLANMKL